MARAGMDAPGHDSAGQGPSVPSLPGGGFQNGFTRVYQSDYGGPAGPTAVPQPASGRLYLKEYLTVSAQDIPGVSRRTFMNASAAGRGAASAAGLAAACTGSNADLRPAWRNTTQSPEET
jgi:hypothetical protein